MATETKPAPKEEKHDPKDKPQQGTADNPKIVATEGSVPKEAAAPGASPPHPSEDKPDETNDTFEVQDARARAMGIDDEDDTEFPTANALKVPDGAPIECIVKQDWFDDRQAYITAGSTYYYQHYKGEVFPAHVLEPVNRQKAKEFKQQHTAFQTKQAEELRAKTGRREALQRLAAETE